MPVIAMTQEIARQGCCSQAQELGLEQPVAHEVVDHVADKMHVSRSLINRLREGKAGLIERLRADRTTASRGPIPPRRSLSSADRGNVVMRGWGATCLLRPVPHVLTACGSPAPSSPAGRVADEPTWKPTTASSPKARSAAATMPCLPHARAVRRDLGRSGALSTWCSTPTACRSTAAWSRSGASWSRGRSSPRPRPRACPTWRCRPRSMAALSIGVNVRAGAAGRTSWHACGGRTVTRVASWRGSLLSRGGVDEAHIGIVVELVV